jgi:hypothetical protein
VDAQPLQIKAVEGSDDRYKILSIPFSGPLSGKDFAGEYFSPRTNLHPEIFPGDRPMLYDHGVDPLLQHTIIGRTNAKTMEQDDLGWWVEAQLDRHGRYFKALKALMDKGALYGSTSAPTALVKKAADGEILDWPVFEQTLTPIAAANGLAGVLSKASGYNIHDNSVGAQPHEFAYIDKDGRGHLPIPDAAHVRAALARFDQEQFPDEATKRKAYAAILAAAKKFGVTVSDDAGEKSARGWEAKAGQVLNKANLAHVQSIHDHAKSMAASMGADACK